MEDLRKITELEVMESVENVEGVSIIVNDNGQAKQIPASLLGGLSGGGGVFIIDKTSDEYSTSNTAYGDTIKEALLEGKTMYYFDGTNYFSISAFKPLETSGSDKFLIIYTMCYSNTSGSVSSGIKEYWFKISA